MSQKILTTHSAECGGGNLGRAVVEAWDGLPEAVRTGILAMVQAAAAKGEGT